MGCSSGSGAQSGAMVARMGGSEAGDLPRPVSRLRDGHAGTATQAPAPACGRWGRAGREIRRGGRAGVGG